MRKYLLLALLFIICSAPLIAQEDSTTGDYLNAAYREQYDFISMTDTIYTFQSELVVPDGYNWLSASKMNAYQNWIANFPIWYKWKHVGIWKGNKAYKADEVTRVIHLPWTGKQNKDFAFPMLIWAEYYLYREMENEFAIIPARGDTLSYPRFLHSRVVRGSLSAVLFKPSETRAASDREFYKLLKICQENSNYKSLTYNCDSIESKNLLPGDLIIAHNEKGTQGITYMVMNVIEKAGGERLYCLATGCAEACDFHIPKFNVDRNNPWINLERIEELFGEYPNRGYFRKVIEK